MIIDRGESVQISFASRSHTGNRRPENQDRYAAYVRDDVYVLAVSDGMGGHVGGDVAAEMAIDAVRAFRLPQDHQMTALKDFVDKTSRIIEERGEAEPDLQFMGATLTMALITPAGCWYAHVGDSRLYRFRNGQLIQLTIDHRFLQEFIDSGKMTEAEARRHPLKSQLDQSLGMPYTEPDIKTFEVHPGDLLLLCSDGLSDELPADTICEILCTNNEMDAMALKLVEIALAEGGNDNITVIVARIGH